MIFENSLPEQVKVSRLRSKRVVRDATQKVNYQYTGGLRAVPKRCNLSDDGEETTIHCAVIMALVLEFRWHRYSHYRVTSSNQRRQCCSSRVCKAFTITCDRTTCYVFSPLACRVSRVACLDSGEWPCSTPLSAFSACAFFPWKTSLSSRCARPHIHINLFLYFRILVSLCAVFLREFLQYDSILHSQALGQGISCWIPL